MTRKPIDFSDIKQDCTIVEGCHRIDGRDFGAQITVPNELRKQWPYNTSAYDFLQFLRPQIQHYGTIEIADLAVNKTNYTLAQRAPQQHGYSSNYYITDRCQSPHQDTPPFPTAFWLDRRRQFFATWIISEQGLQRFSECQRQQPAASIEQIHQQLIDDSLEQQYGILVNQSPGLILIDNSDHHRLYHARTCNFSAQHGQPDFSQDSPMYAFNEVGLLHYIDSLDSRRGDEGRDEKAVAEVAKFIRDNPLS
jgi:hypothetical protein